MLLELVGEDPAVEPEGDAVPADVQQLWRADGDVLCVGVGDAAVGGWGRGVRDVALLFGEVADYAGGAGVEGVGCVADEFPGEPEGFFVT